MGARLMGGGRAGLGGLEFDFAVGEELADTGAFGWGKVVAHKPSLVKSVNCPISGDTLEISLNTKLVES